MNSQLLYLLIVTTTALILLGWITFWLKHLEARRTRRIEKLERFDAVETTAPTTVGMPQSRKEAIKGLETRFSIVRRTFLSLVILAWLVGVLFPFLGRVPTTLISLFITAGAVVVGIAARPMVENFIAGFVLTFSKQFHTGDTILIDNEYGTIEDITASHTVIKLWDWRRYILPNSSMLAKEVFNYTTRDTYLWAKLDFYVAPDADLQLVEETAVSVARKSPLLVGNESPQFWVMGMEKEAIHCWLAAWTRSPGDAWTIRTEVRKALTIELHRKGIRTHLYRHSPEDGRFPPGEGSSHDTAPPNK